MLSSFTVRCQCGELLSFTASGTDLPKDGCCPKCDRSTFFVQPLGNVVGTRLLSRAASELDKGDFTLTIVLSAMAVECEMQRLFIKWKGMDWMRSKATGNLPTSAEEDVWEEKWRQLFRINKKLDRLSKLLTGTDFDSLISKKAAAILSTVYTKHPSLRSYSSAKECLQQELFNKRNKIMHSGQIDSSQVDAEVCFELATALTNILKTMDEHRIALLDAELSAEQEARTTKLP